jgi:hypothetical protein
MHYLTKKRKLENDGNRDDAMDTDQSEDGRSELPRRKMTATEILEKALADVT